MQATVENQAIEPNLELKNIEPTLVNHRTAVVAEIQNDQPTILSNVAISAEVYEDGSNNPLRETEMENASFAPNSTMEFVIDWENQYLDPGDYRLKLLATSGEESWEWDETFTISSEQAQLSEEAVELDRFSWLTPQLLLTVIALLIIVIVVLLLRMRKK